jgi:hypothetical protein
MQELSFQSAAARVHSLQTFFDFCDRANLPCSVATAAANFTRWAHKLGECAGATSEGSGDSKLRRGHSLNAAASYMRASHVRAALHIALGVEIDMPSRRIVNKVMSEEVRAKLKATAPRRSSPKRTSN